MSEYNMRNRNIIVKITENGETMSILGNEMNKILDDESITEGSTEKINLLSKIRPTIYLLQAVGFYPNTFRLRKRTFRKHCLLAFLRIYSTILITFNLIVFGYTAYVTHSFKDAFGMLHAMTVTSIVTGLKPLLNCFNIGIFFKNSAFHSRLLEQFHRTNEAFKANFGCEPNVSTLNRKVKLYFIVMFCVPLMFRIFEYYYMEECFGCDWMSDLSLIIVPFLTVWGMVPLIYFGYCLSLVYFWMDRLRDEISKDKTMTKHSLKFYYRQFLNLTTITSNVGYLFNPFVFFSFTWSVIILCLAIYFSTQSKYFVEAPPATLVPEDYVDKWMDLVYFQIGWSFLQIIVAILHIGTICYFGIKVNEEARAILNVVLTIDLQEETERDRFQVACFVHKICTQYTWCVSVWRAFPIERGVLFTLISIILTYAVILVKLKNSEPCIVYNNSPQLDNNVQTVIQLLNESLINDTSF